MAEPVGKIIRIRNKFGGPPTIAVNTVGEGLRKHINLCFSCSRFRLNAEDQCQIAQESYDLAKKHTVAAPIVRCASFEPTTGVTVQETRVDAN